MLSETVLVTGATGKTGARVATRLNRQRLSVRGVSRRSTPAFDWNDRATWAPCLAGVSAAYINYAPDSRDGSATDTIAAFVAACRHLGVRRLVFLSGRGETEAEACEGIVLDSGLEATIVRSAWFNQNFSEGVFHDMVVGGTLTLPGGAIAEPFVDLDDLADITVAALIDDGHAGEIYEITGPRLLTFADVARELANATGQIVTYDEITVDAFVGGMAASGAPESFVEAMDYLFSDVMDGRNAYTTDDVQRALGRPAKDFSDFAREVAATSTWRNAA